AFRGLIDPTRYPTIALFMAMEPTQVDVNVHPAKAEVRFRNQAIMHGVVLTAVRNVLRKADLTPAVQFETPLTWSQSLQSGQIPQPLAASRGPEFGAGSTPSTSLAPTAPSSFVEYFRRLDPQQKGFVYSEVKQALAEDSPEILREDATAADFNSVES